MIAVIAEKPSVARDIATVLGATKKNDGNISGNGYIVTWAFGHLVGLAMPDAYGIENFRRENLPILPQSFQLIPRQIKTDKGYKPDTGTVKQLKIIKEIFDQCDKIIVATDAGREGELIFRYIYQYLECRKPFVRLWISSLTDKAIRDGLQNLKDGTMYDNLFRSAKARSEADWLIGINASQALSIAAGRGTYSLGRVQTPTLAMICSRYLENKNFVPQKYWQLKLHTGKDSIEFSALSEEKFDSQQPAIDKLQIIKDSGQVQVKSVECKEVNQEPPLLYDLTTLQKEANTKLNFSADKTLSIAQKLYECKLISYPRTGSRYISQDVFDEIPERISLLETYDRFAGYAKSMKGSSLNRRSVDDKKVTDHHALIITENKPGSLQADEQAIYELVAGRMLEAFSQKCVKEVTSISLTSGESIFAVKGTVIKSAGWRTVFNAQEEGEENTVLPALKEGENLPLSDIELLEKQTKPKPLHTESSLLSAMENAGKELEDAELKASMKDSGIGTPATRAAIIETLFTRQYIIREKKALVPTEKGLAVYDIVRDKKIADVEMTGMWENALSKIESGEMNPDTFHKSTEVHASQITSELLGVQLTLSTQQDLTCPKCGTGRILLYPKVAKCDNTDCGLVIFRNKSDKQLTDKQITELVTAKKTGMIKGFRSKAGKPFDASLAFDDQFNVVFVFPEKKGKSRK
ncbi:MULTISPECIES: type IA DNA topoisomerase [Porphyromonas]|uniref:type IA DNA topoisomerase n=1 Tax=Porphyromonas TaxID=836 RepID=UPI00051D4C69|nr:MULTISPECIES: type IA DNA topoisomerase [Porphyromonas]KGL51705.1 DNA topoisomerase I [Porphyromonas canoris]KGL56636.1 DNA topoisomerase I [Porphyromonas sp. COT-052 OH4946]KGN89160.1 DNA topoisomerase I [Porphyromonas gulae]KKC51385.1 DNA topoisomerase I [Porphyromonas gulae]